MVFTERIKELEDEVDLLYGQVYDLRKELEDSREDAYANRTALDQAVDALGKKNLLIDKLWAQRAAMGVELDRRANEATVLRREVTLLELDREEAERGL